MIRPDPKYCATNSPILHTRSNRSAAIPVISTDTLGHPHGNDIRLLAPVRARVGRANSSNLSPTAEHQRPHRSLVTELASQAASGAGTGDYRHREIPPKRQLGAHRCGMRRRQDVHGARDDPCPRSGTAEHDPGDVPLAYHAQVGARDPDDHRTRAGVPDRRYAERRATTEATWRTAR